MLNVLDALKLILIIAAGFGYFLGLGWWVIGPIYFHTLIHKKERESFLEIFPLIFLSGLVLNYGLALLIRSLGIGSTIIGIFSIVGFGFFVMSKGLFGKFAPSVESGKWQIAGVSIFLIFTLSPILALPIANGDARNMWFFYGKMIFYANELSPTAGWTHQSVSISHVDYPIFVSILAAQITHILGFWNEYIPKISLFFMYFPAVLWLFGFAKKSFSFVFLIVLIPISFYPWLWEGTMDGLFATYISLSFLMFGRFLRSNHKVDLLSSVSCLIASVSLKNEGALALIATGIAFLIVFLMRHRRIFKSTDLNKDLILFGVFGLFPFFLWKLLLRIWGVQNDLQIGTIESIKRSIVRVLNGSILQILQSFLVWLAPALIIFGLILFFILFYKIPIHKSFYPPIFASIIYFFGMVGIYLLTPFDLTWHLDHSIFRTILPIYGLLIVSGYYLLLDIEREVN